MKVRFPWSDEVWVPTEKTARVAARLDAYAVRVTVEPAEVLDHAWRRLSDELTSTPEGVLLEGGASLTRLDGTTVEVVSAAGTLTVVGEGAPLA